MKFFSDLGSCYRPISARPSRQREEGEAIHVTPHPTPTRHHAKRMKRFGGSGSASSSAAQHWRPGLRAIREDGVSDPDGKNSERRVHSHCENKSKDRYMSNSRRVSHYDDYYHYSRSNSMPMIIPAFSPAPFML